MKGFKCSLDWEIPLVGVSRTPTYLDGHIPGLGNPVYTGVKPFVVDVDFYAGFLP